MAQTHDEPAQSRGSLRMEEPESLAGRWLVATAKGECAVVFTTRRVESANAWALEDAGNCFAGLVPGAVGWRPVPDGIALASADRRTAALFARGADGWTATLASGAATLRRG
ncbi:AprI/Inh family metalloprotease inhibitor [Sphingomonas sp. SAFR-052]|uniref:AprI/Inh family metalloprotease inhibitor n=1 Tax=Sphingomonas sp. SAFR-052 TaxID=3436867 RepID=UPI003F8024A4